MTVLVVDDERPMRELLAGWLTAAGYAVLEAPTADDAMALLAAHPIAVTLCDRSMPGHDGIWLVEQMRAQFPTVAIILATADDAVPPRVSLQPGVVGYLVKPFRPTLVVDAVRDAIAWHQAAAAAPSRQPGEVTDEWLRRAGRPNFKAEE